MTPELYKLVTEEREHSDKVYAVKLVEKVVWGMVAMILVAFFSAVIKFILL